MNQTVFLFSRRFILSSVTMFNIVHNVVSFWSTDGFSSLFYRRLTIYLPLINLLRLVSVLLAVNILCHSIVGFGFCCYDILPFTFNNSKIKEIHEELFACEIHCPWLNATSVTRIEKSYSFMKNFNVMTSLQRQNIKS